LSQPLTIICDENINGAEWIVIILSLYPLNLNAMKHNAISIRPFIGAKDFDLSRKFYRDLGFEEKELDNELSVFKSGAQAFYLQRAYVKDWIDNTMVFMEVDNVDRFYNALKALDLPAKYEGVRLTPTRMLDWGKECFLHDPSGILWHFGEFAKSNSPVGAA